MNNIQLTKLLVSGHTDDPLDEIFALLSLMFPDFSRKPLTELHHEIELIFSGDHPLYRQSNTKYHNLDHTYSVVLATVRLFHGLFHEGWSLSEETVIKALFSAYFHDCGLLVKKTEDVKTGATFTIGHEKRSMFFMADYLKGKGFSLPFITDCSIIIQSTNLGIDPDTLFFPSEDLQLASFAVGSADFLGQLSDRYYVERLPMLFQEHQEGGIGNYNSAYELMQQTSDFYHNVVVDRLARVFGNLTKFLQVHFRERMGIDRNLYLDSIKNNIKYIRFIIRTCENDMEAVQKYLRRIPPD